jgi:L-seryl-tRNA(Ser) seleniumtransferase
MSTFFRNLPSLNELLEAPPLKQIIDTANRQTVVVSAKKFLAGLEAEVRSATASVPVPNVRELAGQIARWISEGQPPRALPIINATGDLLHPELGAPPLAKEALAAMQIASSGYMASYAGDAATAESLLCELTGAEAAIITNGPPSALMLALVGATERGEIVISRGDLVQSPRGLRISDIAAASGAKLREVGAANKTTIDDYDAALADPCGGILAVRWHPAGQQVPLPELVSTAKRKNAVVIAELGGAPIIDLSAYGATRSTVADAVKSHADFVTFWTGELFGGPSLGVILGKRTAIESLKRKPIYSIVAAQGSILAGLVATLELYKTPPRMIEAIPILSLLSTKIENLQFRAQRIAEQLKAHPLLETVEVEAASSPLGGNSDSLHVFPTYCVKILPKNSALSTISRQLSQGQPGVLLRSRKEYLCIDLRAVFPDQDARIVDAFDALSPPASA